MENICVARDGGWIITGERNVCYASTFANGKTKEADMVLYLCDPEKNAVCKKTFCVHLYSDGECMATANPECAKLDEDGKPIPYAFFGADLAAEKEDKE